MALADWDIYRLNAGSTVAIATSPSLVGMGHLRLMRGTVPAANGWRDNLVPKAGGVLTPLGVLHGALACCVRVESTYTTDAGGAHYLALLCLQSHRDMVNSGGKTCYALCLGLRAATGITTLDLVAFEAALAYPLPTAIWSDALTPAVAKGQVGTFELEWEVNALYSGIRFIVRRGSNVTYSDLTVVHDVVHPLGTLPTTSVGEGLALISNSADTVDLDVRVDQWRLRA
jgi:hypothetical protein